MSDSLVSVVMNCHNSARFLSEAIDSVFAQTYRNWEIIFWDNLSTDGSGDIAQCYDDRLRYFRGEQFVSLGTARNLALEKCRGELVAFLDCDDLWAPEKLEVQVNAAREHPEAGLFFSDSYFIDSGGQVVRRGLESLDWGPLEDPGDNGFRELLLQGCFVDIETALVRKAVLEEIGGFDPRYTHVEDYDMWLRIARRHRIHGIRAPLARWRIHEGQYSQTHSRDAFREQVLLSRGMLRDDSLSRDMKAHVKTRFILQTLAACRSLFRERRFLRLMLTGLFLFRFPLHLPMRVGLPRLKRRAAGAA